MSLYWGSYRNAVMLGMTRRAALANIYLLQALYALGAVATVALSIPSIIISANRAGGDAENIAKTLQIILIICAGALVALCFFSVMSMLLSGLGMRFGSKFMMYGYTFLVLSVVWLGYLVNLVLTVLSPFMSTEAIIALGAAVALALVVAAFLVGRRLIKTGNI